MQKKIRDYDEKRKRQSQRTLLRAIDSLSSLVEHQGKPITKNELSKRTGVARTTIERYPDVLNKLERVNAELVQVKAREYVTINPDTIQSLDEAKALLCSLISLYNEQQKELQNNERHINDLEKLITARDKTIAELMSEKNELKDYIKSISKSRKEY